MSDQESDVALSDLTNSKLQQTKIFLELLPNGHIFVDWSDLPIHRNSRQCVLHYKSLNNNRSHAIRVSRKNQNIILQKIETGHLYEVHVCTVDRWNRILASSEHAQIQTKTLNEAPILRVIKSTPDFIWLEWEKSNDVRLSDIKCFKLMINGQTKAILPPTENKFVVNDGEFGERYIFQLEMSRKDGKAISSLPISVNWPGVTIPKRHAFVNGCEELIICWGDSISINDGNIESYTLHLHDSEGHLINKIGPNSTECRQILIKDITKGVYFYVVEIKLANSNKSLHTKPMKIECGRESLAPILTCDYIDLHNRKKLINMAFHLINIRDNMKSKRLLEKCDNQLKQILSAFTSLTDSVRLSLNIQSKSNENLPKNYRLIIDGEEQPASLPLSVKNFPLELPRRDKPYELSVSITPDFYGTKSKKVLVDASGHFAFFCDHFTQHPSIKSCSYTETFPREKQLKRSINQGLIKPPQEMQRIQVYDLNENKIIYFPSNDTRRLSIVLFYINQCVPSINHLNYFSNYASNHRTQYNYISINCNQDDIDEIKNRTDDFKDIQCYTDFSSDDFEYEQKENEAPLHELLSLEGTPTYFILDFSGRIVWKGRLSIENQSEYDTIMDHIISDINQNPCSADNCQICDYRSMNDTRIDSELNEIAKNLIQQRASEPQTKQQEEKYNRVRVISMKNN